jgi:hypothetical protein
VRGRDWSVILGVVGLLIGATTIASCTHVECSQGIASGTIVGMLTSIRGTSATFAVATWTPNPEGPALTTPPVQDANVVVRYTADEITFLRTGERYSVEVSPDGDGIGSGVHRAGSCSGGTIYANGKSIDTSVWSRSIVQRALVGFVVLCVVLLVFLAWITRRNRRAQNASKVVLESPRRLSGAQQAALGTSVLRKY